MLLLIVFFLSQLIFCFNKTPVIFGTLDGTVMALDTENKEVLWKFSTGGPLIQYSGEKHVIPSLDGTLYVVTPEGHIEVCLFIFKLASDPVFIYFVSI